MTGENQKPKACDLLLKWSRTSEEPEAFKRLARRIDVKLSTLVAWIFGRNRPTKQFAKAIETATDGKVPASAWNQRE